MPDKIYNLNRIHSGFEETLIFIEIIQTDVVKPLKLDDFIDQEVKNLSG